MIYLNEIHPKQQDIVGRREDACIDDEGNGHIKRRGTAQHGRNGVAIRAKRHQHEYRGRDDICFDGEEAEKIDRMKIPGCDVMRDLGSNRNENDDPDDGTCEAMDS